MISYIPINYSQAKLLSENYEHVIVFEPSSGMAWEFDNKIWRYQSIRHDLAFILIKLGTGRMDIHYCFAWVKADPK